MAESPPIGLVSDTHLLGIQQRPTSALGFPNVYDCLDVHQMSHPDDNLTTSLKSVFDCDLGCFVNTLDGQPVAYLEDERHHQKIVQMSDLDLHHV